MNAIHPLKVFPVAILLFAGLLPVGGATSYGVCIDHDDEWSTYIECYGATTSSCYGDGMEAGAAHWTYTSWGRETTCYAYATHGASGSGPYDTQFSGVCYDRPSLHWSEYVDCVGLIEMWSPSGYVRCVGTWEWYKPTGDSYFSCTMTA